MLTRFGRFVRRWWILVRIGALDFWETTFGVSCKNCGEKTKDPYGSRWDWGADPLRPSWRCASCAESEEDKEDESWWMN